MRDGAHHLPHQDAGRVVRHQVRFRHANQLETVLPKVRNDGFLHHQVARQAVQFLDNHRPHAIGVKRRHQFRPRRPVRRFFCTAHALFPVDGHNLDIVRRGVCVDRGQLPGEAVAVDLPFAGNPEVCVSLCHASIIRHFCLIVNTNSVEKVSVLKRKQLSADASKGW